MAVGRRPKDKFCTDLLEVRDDEVLRLEDEDDSGDEAERRDRPEDAASVFQEEVTQNHHL